MRVIIIEDEDVTADDLKQTIEQADSSIKVICVLKSVAAVFSYFKENEIPDLIFSDIRLGDGLSFEALKELNVPIVFCTAYDEYALNAFKVNGIDYIMKPFTLSSVSAALQKYKNLTRVGQEEISKQYQLIRQLFSDNSRSAKDTSLLIRFQDKIIPLRIETIAIFRLENTIVRIYTFDGKTYYPNHSLEELESMSGSDFFRVNRQYLMNRKAIHNVSSSFSRKLSVSPVIKLDDQILVSREKAPLFLKWLSGA